MKRRLIALVVLAVLSIVPLATPAAAADPPVLLKMVQPIEPVMVKEPFKVVVRPSAPITEQAQVTVSIYFPLAERTDIGNREFFTGRAGQSKQTRNLSKMGRTADNDFIVEFPLTTDQRRADRDKILLVRGPGVYPIRVELTDGKSPVQQLESYLTVISDPTEKVPLDVSVAVPIAAPLSLQPDGSRAFQSDELDRLGQLAKVLKAYPTRPLTIIPSPETIVGLSRNAETRPVWSEIESAIGDRPVVAPPYVPMDAPAFVGTGATDELTRQLTAGNDALAAMMPGRIDAQTFFSEGYIDAFTAERLQGDRVNHVVLDPGNLEDGKAATTTVVELAGLQGPSPSVIAASTSTMQRFMLTPDVVQATTELWADLAQVWTQGGVGVVLVARDLPSLKPDKLDALLGALGGIGYFTQMVSLDAIYTDVASTQSRSKEPTAKLVPPQREPLGSYTDRISEARFRQVAITSMLPAGDPRRADLAERLLVSSARGLKIERRNEFLTSVQQRLDEVVSCIEAPSDDRLSVFAESSDLPVAVTNRCNTPLTVTIRLSSDRLDFPKGSSRTVTLEPSLTLRTVFDVRVRTAGPIPVNIELLTPTPIPLRLGQPSRMTVSSGAVSGIGITLSVVAGALLSLWWIVHLRAKRRIRLARRAELSRQPKGPENSN